MDQIDRRLLGCLQREGRMSNQELSERVGISTAASWRRVKALEAEGIITGYSARLERGLLGLNLCAYVHVTLSRHIREHTRAFEVAIQKREEVMECFATTGDADFILRVVTQNIETFDHFLEEFLLDMPEISQVRSNIALRELKTSQVLPIA